MVLTGLKFGLGFCLGMCVFTAVLIALICLSSWVSQLWRKMTRTVRRGGRASKGGEWKRTSASRGDGTIQSFSFCSVIRWEDKEDRTKRRHRDEVR